MCMNDEPRGSDQPSTRLSEVEIKLLLLEFLTSRLKSFEHCLAVEAKYAENLRRADVLAITNETIAFEIKSDFDRLDKLPDQLKDYRRTFDKLFVVTTPKHQRKIRPFLGENDGLIVVENRELRVLKEARKNKSILKKNLAAICSRQALSNALGAQNRKSTVGKLRESAQKKLDVPNLHLLALAELKQRFMRRYNTFIEESAIPLRETDLKALNHSSKFEINSH